MLNLILENKTSHESKEMIYNNFHSYIKYYCGKIVLDKIAREFSMSDYRRNNLKNDIFLDMNIPDMKGYKKIYTNITSGVSDTVCVRNSNNMVYKFIALERNNELYFLKRKSNNVTKYYLNYARIVDEYIMENWGDSLNIKNHPNYVIPLVINIINGSIKSIINVLDENLH